MGTLLQNRQRVTFPTQKAQAKAAQAYNSKPTHPVCANCKHFRYETEIRRNLERQEYLHAINLRCNIGGFAVIRTAACNQHTPK